MFRLGSFFLMWLKYEIRYMVSIVLLGVASTPKLPRKMGGCSSSTFHPWQFDTFWNPQKIVLYVFISKNRHEQDWKKNMFFIFFCSCFALSQLCVCFQYTIFLDCAILRKCLYTTVSVAGRNQRYIHQRRRISLLSESQQF